MFGPTNIVKTSEKENYVCSGYGIIFDNADSRSFDNDFARNVIIFGVYKSSSSHSDNRKNNFSILGEGTIYGTTRSFGSPDKTSTLTLLKQTQNVVCVYIIMLIIVICLFIEKKFW